MENIVKKLFLGGCVAVALAVSMVSLATYAQTAEGSAAEAGLGTTATFQLTVPKAIEITATTPGSIPNASIDAVNETSISATVYANDKYTISLHSTQPALTSASNDTIPVVGANGVITGGVSNWGIKQKTSATADASAYTALTTSPVAFYTSAAAAGAGATTTFAVGVGVSPTQAIGTYSTNVIVTAAIAP